MFIKFAAKERKKNYVNKTFTLFLNFIILSLSDRSNKN